MRSKEIVATIAVVGAVAAFALFNVNTMPSHATFLSNTTDEVEKQFLNFMNIFDRSYMSKEEYMYRLGVFT